MCGILGYSGKKTLTDECISSCLSLLAHRGPDAFGVKRFSIADSQAVFAHRRLSILDLSDAGLQPMSKGSWTVTYNGEIYNAPDLRKELMQLGVVFESTCDTEVLCYSLRCWGITKTLNKLNGMFAFAATDGETIYLVRDRLGIKPLYYWIHNKSIFFASELGALEQLPQFEKKIDESALHHYLAFGYVPAPLCIYKNCSKLEPGTILNWKNGKYSVEQYWDVNLNETGTYTGDVAQALNELDGLLNDSISIRRQSDVPLGAFLSGGIDSSLLCAIAQKQMGRQLKTFTIGFESAKIDESIHANVIAEYLETNHTNIRMTGTDLVDIVPRIPSIYGEPFADPSALPKTKGEAVAFLSELENLLQWAKKRNAHFLTLGEIPNALNLKY